MIDEELIDEYKAQIPTWKLQLFLHDATSEEHFVLKCQRFIRNSSKITGLKGYQKLLEYIDFKKMKDLNWNKYFKQDELIEMKKKKWNIQQDVNKEFVGKIIEASSIDKNGAYVSWFSKPLPFGKPKRLKPEMVWVPMQEGFARYVVGKDLCRSGWNIQMDERDIKEILEFKLQKYEGADRLVEDYKNKVVDKLHAVVGIGYLSRHSMISSYIWFKQGELISEIRNILQKKNVEVFKFHTDSITFEPKGFKYVQQFVENGEFKIEYQNKRMFICHQAAYQVEGSVPKGITNAVGFPNELTWEKNGTISTKVFPCIFSDDKLLVNVKEKGKTVQQWKTLLQIGTEEYKKRVKK